MSSRRHRKSVTSSASARLPPAVAASAAQRSIIPVEDRAALNTPALPQELIANIIEHLANDKSTLHASSLVCRSWAQPTATLLFHHRRWPKCPHYWSRTRKVDNCSCAFEKPRLPRLREFLLASNRVSHSLRELEINFERVPGGARPDKPTDRMPMGCISVEELMDVFDAAPNLKSVKISGANGSSWAIKNRSMGQENRKLDNFQVSDTLHLDPYAIAALVSYFCRVSTVMIGPNVRASLPQISTNLPSISAERSRVGILTFHPSCHTQSVVKYLQVLGTVIDASCLAEVEVNLPLPEEDIAGFTCFLDHAHDLDRCTVMFGPELKTRGDGPGLRALEYWTSLIQLLPHCSAKRIVVHRECLHHPESMTPVDILEYFRSLEWHQLNEAIGLNGRLEGLKFSITTGLDMREFDEFGLRDALRPIVPKRLFDMLSFAFIQRSEYYKY